MKDSIQRSRLLRGRLVEAVMNGLFLLCGLAAVVCVVFISAYMVIQGGPALAKIGVFRFLFGQVWDPTHSIFGVWAMVLSSLSATFCAVLVALPVGVLVAVFLAKLAPSKIAAALRAMIDLLAGIPSVVYGLLGALLIAPRIYRLQAAFDLPAGGSLLAAIFLLVIMILPTIISVAETALRTVPRQYAEAALALGSTKLQAIFRVEIPAAKSGIVTGMVLGTGRAIGEAMAVMMVAGNASLLPSLLKPVRLLTSTLALEWAYAGTAHKQALYGVGLVLFLFIMLINVALRLVLKKGRDAD
jgi:phosphate transport system permease protein